MSSQVVNFRITAASLAEETDERRAELKGILNAITIHFPPGCNSLTDVAVYVRGVQVIPDKGYISLDDATPVFHPSQPTEVGDSIVVQVVNTDDTNEHTISVICEICGLMQDKS